MSDFIDILSPAGSIAVDTAKSAIGNAFNSWSGDSSKNKSKKLMHYQDVLNQKSLTETPTSARLGYESAGLSPALALGTSAPTVSAGSAQMGNYNSGEPFSDTLTKGQQRRLMKQEAKLTAIRQYTDFVNAIGTNGTYLENAGFNVPEIVKRTARELGLSADWPMIEPKEGDNGGSLIRTETKAKIGKDVADTAFSNERVNTEKSQQGLNKANENLSNAKVDTEFTIQDLNTTLSRLNDEKAQTEKHIRKELDSRSSLQTWQKKEIQETFGLLWEKMRETIDLMQEQRKLATAQANSSQLDADLKEQALAVEKEYNKFRQEMAKQGINLLTESDKDMAVVKKYKEEGHYGRLTLYYIHKILNIFNAGATVSKSLK